MLKNTPSILILYPFILFLSCGLNLCQEYSPATRLRPGVVSLRQGQQYYEACLRWYLGQHVTAEEVFHLGIKEVNRIEELIKQVSRWTSDGGRVNMF